ncbi:MAG: sugar phosphate isomerase/epimerase [candidate division KSB1 bacterium]|nr:sugar phosphate isomerase/epimerase [candidate division KSB1 bacterium]MDZ7336147.1 sugar phosphate isomerase/epimerase [candidate division KSB1 bacterium]MDZ7357692.1 sugar phosphate isomerase/epimerase [candidate division KSB1 bacterium]MDZ7375194.1 sugar phosphate isomerase/epimerase [candidate division KSB1 bacterium]MDZ7401290.1 sugar phosphate isomerase/epimerase [candidate division KSB1 bacterium]
MQIGFSFFWQKILGLDEPNHPEIWQKAMPDIDQTLSDLKSMGIESIELKLTRGMEQPLLFQAIAKLIGLGFRVTFHVPTRFQFPEPMDYQLAIISTITNYMVQQFCTMPLWVIHPLNSKTAPRQAIFDGTLNYLDQILALPAARSAAFALENLRNRTDGGKIHVGDSFTEILALFDKCDHQLGICWDFGHSIAMHQRGLESQFPPIEFLKKVIHCHVHDCLNQQTHLPLGMGDVPIERNIALLMEHNFQGIFNLELSPHKIDEPENFLHHLDQSVRRIRQLIR